MHGTARARSLAVPQLGRIDLVKYLKDLSLLLDAWWNMSLKAIKIFNVQTKWARRRYEVSSWEWRDETIEALDLTC